MDAPWSPNGRAMETRRTTPPDPPESPLAARTDLLTTLNQAPPKNGQLGDLQPLTTRLLENPMKSSNTEGATDNIDLDLIRRGHPQDRVTVTLRPFDIHSMSPSRNNS